MSAYANDRHDLPLPVWPQADVLEGWDPPANLARARGFVQFGQGCVEIRLCTDSDKLLQWFGRNYAASSGTRAVRASAELVALSGSAQRYNLPHPVDAARWWSAQTQRLVQFGTDSYAVVKVSVRGICSAVAPRETLFAHGCALEFSNGGSTRGLLVMGSSGAGKTTLVSGLRRVQGCQVRIVNDDWGAVDLTDGSALATGEQTLHMKMLSVKALRPEATNDWFDLHEGALDEHDPGHRVLADPAAVYGAESLQDFAQLTAVVVVTRAADAPSGLVGPCSMTTLEEGAYAAYYRRNERFFNGAIFVDVPNQSEVERGKYEALIERIPFFQINNATSPDDLVASALAAIR